MMGAHTLVDVLATVPGIQTNERGGLGSFNDLYIQGATAVHILFMLDGVALNLMATQFTDFSGIPIQNIDRIEILKGPAPHPGDPALGGVINIITKSPIEGEKAGGTLSFSAWERGTRDSRGELPVHSARSVTISMPET